jgi:hypothetical protein
MNIPTAVEVAPTLETQTKIVHELQATIESLQFEIKNWKRLLEQEMDDNAVLVRTIGNILEWNGPIEEYDHELGHDMICDSFEPEFVQAQSEMAEYWRGSVWKTLGFELEDGTVTFIHERRRPDGSMVIGANVKFIDPVPEDLLCFEG